MHLGAHHQCVVVGSRVHCVPTYRPKEVNVKRIILKFLEYAVVAIVLVICLKFMTTFDNPNPEGFVPHTQESSNE